MRSRQLSIGRNSLLHHALPERAAVALAMTMCGSVIAQTPEIVFLNGTVRDFRRFDSEFNVTPSHGNGHYAGNIGLVIGSDDRPEYAGAGFKVSDQWRDGGTNPIAPHLFSGSGEFVVSGDVLVDQEPGIAKQNEIDTWDSSAGTYAETQSDDPPNWVAGSEMPNISVPSYLSSLPNQGVVNYSGGSVISSNLHCDTLNGSDSIVINGKISMLVEDNFALATQTEISLTPGSTLTVYMLNGGSSWNHVNLNSNTGNPNLVKMINLGTADFMIHNHADVYVTYIAPDSILEINNHGALYGKFWGKQMIFGNHGDFHADVSDNSTSSGATMCGAPIEDSEGSPSASSSGGIHSATAFDRWYQDVLGKNLSANHEIGLIRNSSGIYEYLDDAFYPIDGLMYGNQGQPHNFYFTYTIPITFTHVACDGRFFEFQGADDAWLFVNGDLAIDLGGVMPGTVQHFDFDRLDLVDGETYTMHFFYAQRNPTMSSFRMRTNADIESNNATTSVSAAFD